MRRRGWSPSTIAALAAAAVLLMAGVFMAIYQERLYSEQQVKSVLLQPQAIFPENVKDVVADGFTSADKICTTDALKKACEKNGVSG